MAAAAAPTAAVPAAQVVHGRASGTFEVEVTPQAQPADAPGNRLMLHKRFAGDLAGRSVGEMLASGAATSSGAYVAIERVTARLAGREGGFVLVHRGIMNAGRANLSVEVVPGSGSGGLAGLSGAMAIRVEGGRHFYTFDYSLPQE